VLATTLAVVVLAWAGSGFAGLSADCVERRVTLGVFGTDEWALHFSVALADRLRREGFTVVTDSEESDLTLSGHVTMTPVEAFRFGGGIRMFTGRTESRLQPTVSVTAVAGLRSVWSRLYESTKSKTLADWAEDAAEDLAKACQRRWRP
jgi:hypothetical protein